MQKIFGALLFALSVIVTSFVAFQSIFVGFAIYDDEGYLLISLKSFQQFGSLYDRVFTQYGPFYYEFMTAVTFLTGMSVSHENGRWITLSIWILSSVLLGAATFVGTRSVLSSVFVQITAFMVLLVLQVEPMHPGGLTTLLLSAIVLAFAVARERTESPYVFATIGGLAAALVFVKINIGVFAVASIAVTSALFYRKVFGRIFIGLVFLGFVLIPIALMGQKLGQAWAQLYSAHVFVALSVFALIALAEHQPQQRHDRELLWLVGGFAISSGIICAVALLTGTSLSALAYGIFVAPLLHPGNFFVAMNIPARSFLFDAIGVAAALFVLWLRPFRQGPLPNFIQAGLSAFSIVVGIVMMLALTGQHWDSMDMLAFCWVPLLKLSDSEDEGKSQFFRMSVSALALLQSLHAYPVAGSQIGFSLFLLSAVGGIALAKGLAGLSVLFPPERFRVELIFVVVCWLALLTQAGRLRDMYERVHSKFASAYRLASRARGEFELKGPR